MTLQRISSSQTYRGLITRLLDTPQLVRDLQALPGPTFAALVQSIGVEDAGELIAMATREQLVAAFDEDLFRSRRPGAREIFDPERFVTWLEVLLEAGEATAARRIAALSPDFLVQALSSLVLVLDHDALLTRMSEGGRGAYYADKALESSLSEELEGYLIIARQPDGWDAVLALLLALDQQQRPLLERLLDRCADLARGYLDDLQGLHEVLSAADSLAEDVEAEREERRTRQGYVEPRAARSFLKLCQQPLTTDLAATPRDPMTAAYFRDRPTAAQPEAESSRAKDVDRAVSPLAALLESESARSASPPMRQLEPGANSASSATANFLAALARLHEEAPALAATRMDELGYLANVLVAGAAADSSEGGRLRPIAAAEAVLATVALGAELAAGKTRGRAVARTASSPELLSALRHYSADLLFRAACSALAADPARRQSIFVPSTVALEAILASRPPTARTTTSR